MEKQIKKIEEVELTIERLEVICECTEDVEIKNTITATILRLQMLLNEVCEDITAQNITMN